MILRKSEKGSRLRSLVLFFLFSIFLVVQANEVPVQPGANSSVVAPSVLELDRMYDSRPKFDDEILTTLKLRPVSEDFEVLYRLSRLVYYAGFFILAESTDKHSKIELFQYGADLATRARTLAPKRVEGHYWFSVNKGGYGLTKGIFSSLSGAKAMLEALDEAIKIDPKYYFAGPLRVRGRLFFKLPGGFISFGDNKKALEDLQKAVALAPENRLNHMYLADVFDKTSKTQEAIKELEIAKMLPDIAVEREEKLFKKELIQLEKRFK